MRYGSKIPRDEIAQNDELEFIHHGADILVRLIIGLLIEGWAIYNLIRFSTILWAALLIGILLIAVQRIHIIEKTSMTVSNYLGIGIPFVGLQYRIIFMSRNAIVGTNPISVEKKSRTIHTDFSSVDENLYKVRIKHESGYVVLSTFTSAGAAKRKSDEMKEFLSP